MIKIKVLLAMLVFTVLMSLYVYAELNEAEEQVVFYVNYLQEMSYTAEYTEGMPKEGVEEYLNENISHISEVYKISPNDIKSLMLNKSNNKPLPGNYKGPIMPTDEGKMELNEKMKESVARYSEQREH